MNQADLHRLKLAPHFVMEQHIHLACAYPHEAWVEHIEWLEPAFNERIEIRDGRMLLPDRPRPGFHAVGPSRPVARWRLNETTAVASGNSVGHRFPTVFGTIAISRVSKQADGNPARDAARDSPNSRSAVQSKRRYCPFGAPTMNNRTHDMPELFAQLGLPADARAHQRFHSRASPARARARTRDGTILEPGAGRRFLDEALAADADWAPVVDALNLELHRGHWGRLNRHDEVRRSRLAAAPHRVTAMWERWNVPMASPPRFAAAAAPCIVSV